MRWSLIKQSFRCLAKASRLGDHWRSVRKRVRHGSSRKLSDSQVKWIIRARDHGTGSRGIAHALEGTVSVRRVEQVYAEYRKTGQIPSFGSPGGPKVEIPTEERTAIRYARSRFKVGACYLVPETSTSPHDALNLARAETPMEAY